MGGMHTDFPVMPRRAFLVAMICCAAGHVVLATPDAHRASILRAKELGKFLKIGPIVPRFERISQSRNDDGSIEVRCQYSPPEGEPFTMTSKTCWNINESNARGCLSAYHLGSVSVLGTFMKLVPRRLSLGDDHRAYLIVAYGKPWGNYVVLRKGCVVMSFLVKGVHLEDAPAIEGILHPWLQRAMACPPAKTGA